MRAFIVRQPPPLRGAVALPAMGVVRLGIALGWLPPEWASDEARIEQVLESVRSSDL